jgi:hypothetical protein
VVTRPFATDATEYKALIYLFLFAFLATTCDQCFALFLGSTTVFLGPPDNSGQVLPIPLSLSESLWQPASSALKDFFLNLAHCAGSSLALLVVFATPLAYFLGPNLHHGSFSSLRLLTIAKACLPLLLCLGLLRENIMSGASFIKLALCWQLLLLQLSMSTALTTIQALTKRPLPYVTALAAGFFLGQWMALTMEAQLLSNPPQALTFLSLVGGLFCSLFFAGRAIAIADQTKKKEDFIREALAEEYLENQLNAKPELLNKKLQGPTCVRFLFATVALFLPLYAPLVIGIIFSIKGYLVGSLPIYELAQKLSMACALGCLLSPFLHLLATKRTTLQSVAALLILLYSAGTLTHSLALAQLTLITVAGIAGILLPDWYHHLLTHLNKKQLPLFLGLKDSMLMATLVLISLPLESKLATMSSLYFMKELNLTGLILTAIAVLFTPGLLSLIEQNKPRIKVD